MRTLYGCLALTLLALCSCGNEHHAGGVTDIGNSVAGTIVNAQGHPQAGARVSLLHVDVNVAGSTLLDSISVETDEKGTFIVQNVTPGKWVVKGSSGSLAAVDQVEKVQNVGVDSLTMVLGGLRTLTGHIISNVAEGYAFVPGVANSLHALDSTGAYEIPALPPGHFELCFTDSEQVYCRSFMSLIAAGTASVQDLRPSASSLDVVEYAVDSVPSYYLGKDFASVSATDAPVVSAWLVSRELQVDIADAAPSQSLLAFPLAVNLDSSNFDFSRMHSAGADLRILDSLGKSLPFEIEHWDSASARALVWVRIPLIVAGQTRIRLWALGDNAQVASASSSTQVFASGDGFLGVYHFAESTLDSLAIVRDASSMGHHGIMGQASFGRSPFLGSGLTFDGDDDFVNLGKWDPCSSDFTASLWVYWNGINGRHQVLFAKRNAWLPDSTRWQWHYDLFSGGFGIYQIDSTQRPLFSPSAVTFDAWSHLAMVYHADSVRMWVNGVEIGSAQAFVPGGLVSAIMRLGGSDAGESWNGSFDEVRLESVSRNEDWIRLSQATQRRAANIQ